MRTALAAVALLAACQGTPEPQGAVVFAPPAAGSVRPGMSPCDVLGERLLLMRAEPERVSRGEVLAIIAMPKIDRLAQYMPGGRLTPPLYPQGVCGEMLHVMALGRLNGWDGISGAARWTPAESESVRSELAARGITW